MPFERRPGAERNNRQLKARADADDLDDFLRRGREAHDIRRGRRMVRLAMAVVLANGHRIGSAGAEQRFQLGNRCVDRR